MVACFIIWRFVVFETVAGICPETKYCQCTYNELKESYDYYCKTSSSAIHLNVNLKNLMLSMNCKSNADKELYNLLPNLTKSFNQTFSWMRIQKFCVVPDHFTTITDLLPLPSKLSMAAINLRFLNHDFFNKPSTIVELNLSGNRLEHLNDSTFWNLTLLQKIDLSKNRFATLPAVLFKGNFRLLHFILTNQNVTFELKDKFFSNLNSLQTISLINVGIQSLPNNIFENSTNINEINLNGNNITQIDG